MGAAIEYAETYKDAKDLVKLVRRAASSLFEVCVVATASGVTQTPSPRLVNGVTVEHAQAVLSKGDGGGPDVATRYYERALPNLKEASAKLDAVVKLLPK